VHVDVVQDRQPELVAAGVPAVVEEDVDLLDGATMGQGTLGSGQLELNPTTTPPAPHRNRCHPCPGISVVAGGEAQPMKKKAPLLSATLNRGEPLSQCEPLGPWAAATSEPGLRMS